MKQPITCFIGGRFTNTQKDKINETTTSYFYENDYDIESIINHISPQVFVTIGNVSTDFKTLLKRPLRDSKKWLHFKTEDEAIEKVHQLYYCFVSHAIEYHQDQELVSLFTTSYKSEEYIQRPFQTLLSQTYTHWEWIIFDDTDGDDNFENLKKLREADSRVRVYRAEKNNGVIGHMKQLASSLARGSIIIELDHDDDLTPNAIELCVKAFKEYPDAGFAYSDFCEIHEDGQNFSYGDMFALGYGSYRKEWNEDRLMWVNVVCSPPINPVTIRYLVACPNHFRAWRASSFREMGGWNPAFHVADDYEIMVRSFINTRMVRIPQNCYYQYRNKGGNNHTFIRNREIQKLWKTISNYYNSKVHDRVVNFYQQEDPYYTNWKEYQRFQRCWVHSRFEPELNYRLKLRGNIEKPLVSIVIISQNNAEKTRNAIFSAINQSYDPIEIFVIGNKCQYLENIIEDITSSKTENGKNFNVDRIKKDLKWWNLSSESNWESCLNYACKLCILGDIVSIFDVEKPEEYNNFYGNEFINKSIDLLNQSDEIEVVKLKGSNNIVHKTSLFEKHGFWNKDIDLVKIWLDNKIKIREI